LEDVDQLDACLHTSPRMSVLEINILLKCQNVTVDLSLEYLLILEQLSETYKG